MIAKVVLGTMQNARKLVSIVEAIPYDAELCAGRYVVNAKSMSLAAKNPSSHGTMKS